MRNLVVIFLFSLCSLFASGQSFAWKGTITDKNTQKPVENAHIVVNSKGNKIHFISDKDGFVSVFCPDFAGIDTVVVSHIAYETQTFNPEKLKTHTIIELNDRSLLLADVEIKPQKEKYIVVGPTFPALENAALGLRWGEKRVVFFSENIYEKGTLEKVEFAFSNNFFLEKGDTIGYRMPVMLKIYARDTLNNIPGEELLKDTIMVVRQKKNRKVQIDISSCHIKLPQGGIYCGVEAFPLKWYIQNGYLSEDNLSYTTKSQTGGGYTFYAPMLVAKSNKKHIYQNYQLGGFAKEWKNITTTYNITLIIRLHIKMIDEN
jgi:hypothetical protein